MEIVDPQDLEPVIFPENVVSDVPMKITFQVVASAAMT